MLLLQDVEVVNMSLTALNALAFYQYQAICRGQEGLGVHAVASSRPDGTVKEGVLAHFLRSVMQFLLFEDYRWDLSSFCTPFYFGIATWSSLLGILRFTS
jgi:hypothetical protein